MSCRAKHFKIICIIGSTKFMEEMQVEAERLTWAGNIVLMPMVVTSEQVVQVNKKDKAMLTLMHFEKMDMADEIFVVNPDGYTGDSTKAEIEYAKEQGKTIFFSDCTGL